MIEHCLLSIDILIECFKLVNSLYLIQHKVEEIAFLIFLKYFVYSMWYSQKSLTLSKNLLSFTALDEPAAKYRGFVESWMSEIFYGHTYSIMKYKLQKK